MPLTGIVLSIFSTGKFSRKTAGDKGFLRRFIFAGNLGQAKPELEHGQGADCCLLYLKKSGYTFR